MVEGQWRRGSRPPPPFEVEDDPAITGIGQIPEAVPKPRSAVAVELASQFDRVWPCDDASAGQPGTA